LKPVAAYPGPCPRQAERGRAALKQTYTWHYSTQGLPAIDITNNSRELLPHIFTLVSPKRDSYFLWHYLYAMIVETQPLTLRLFTGGLLYAVRTFLPPLKTEDDSSGLKQLQIYDLSHGNFE